MAHAVGNNPFLLKTLLGHTQITTTDRYIHASMPEGHRGYNALSTEPTREKLAIRYPSQRSTESSPAMVGARWRHGHATRRTIPRHASRLKKNSRA